MGIWKNKIAGLWFFFSIIINTNLLFGQSVEDIETIRSEIKSLAKSLASPEMYGRGYQHDGHVKAADFIARNFKDYGLKPAMDTENPWFQNFKFSINLIGDSVSLSLNGNSLVAGKDFIVQASSPRCDLGHLKIVDLGYGMPWDFKKSYKDKIVVIKSGLPEEISSVDSLKQKYARFQSDDVKIDFAAKFQVSGVIIVKEKLTASLSLFPQETPAVAVLERAIPGKKLKKASMFVDAKFNAVTSQNVIGMVEGKKFRDSVIVVSAHYDHLGTQGRAIFYGGNDNASGTSVMMSLAKHFAKPENQPDYTMAFIAFSGEEAGLLGSDFYVKHPVFPLEKTKFIMNLDLMANGDEGITAVAGLDYPDYFEKLKAVNEELKAVPKVKGRKNAPNSDHYHFVEKGVKGMFIYTMGGPPHYHDVNDTYEEMKFSKTAEIRNLLIRYFEEIMK